MRILPSTPSTDESFILIETRKVREKNGIEALLPVFQMNEQNYAQALNYRIHGKRYPL